MPHDDDLDKKIVFLDFENDDVLNLVQNVLDNLERLFIIPKVYLLL